MSLGRYRKSIAALVTGSLAWGAQVVASKPHAVTAAEWLALGGVVAVALGVAGVAANDPPAPPPVAPPDPEPVVAPLP